MIVLDPGFYFVGFHFASFLLSWQENSSLLHNTELLERDLEQAEAERNLSAVELERLQREVVAQNEDKKSLESSLDARMRAKDAVVGDLESQGAAVSGSCTI